VFVFLFFSIFAIHFSKFQEFGNRKHLSFGICHFPFAKGIKPLVADKIAPKISKLRFMDMILNGKGTAAYPLPSFSLFLLSPSLPTPL